MSGVIRPPDPRSLPRAVFAFPPTWPALLSPLPHGGCAAPGHFTNHEQEYRMKSMNRVFLIGNLGADPELQISKVGKTYTRLRLATHRSWLNKDDQWEERTDWHSVFVWGRL